MGWEAAAVGALGFAQYKQQGAIGRYNQRIQERNAQVAEQQAEQLDKKLEFDIAQFNKQFEQLQGQTEVSFSKSGVVAGEGTAARIAIANLIEAENQREIMRYNSEVAQAQKIEEANFARMQGQLARQEAKLAQIQTISQTGTSLLKMRG